MAEQNFPPETHVSLQDLLDQPADLQSPSLPSTSEQAGPSTQHTSTSKETLAVNSVEGGGNEEEEEDEDMVSQVNQFFAELSTDKGRKKRRLFESGTNLPRRKSVLPPHLCQVMGNANLRLATGDKAGAIELCMEIIRQAPHASEPYLALATIYEDLGYDEKLLGILMIASHLKRSDRDMWIKTSNLAVKLKDHKIAMHCINKALKLAPSDVFLLWQKSSLHSELNEPRKALDTLNTLINVLPGNMSEQYLEVTKEMARLHHSLQETPQAIDLLGQLLASHHNLVDEEVINLLSELCIITKAYQQAYEVITDYFGMITQSPDDATSPMATNAEDHVTSHDKSATPLFSLTATLRMSIAGDEMEGSVGDLEQHTLQPHGNLHVPEDVPVDLRVKLAVSMIHLGVPLPEELLQPIFYNPDNYGDLFLDVTDALTECGEHAKALPLLTALVNTTKYSQAGVWLKLAECQHMLGDLEASALAYSKVVSHAPNHTESRLRLATLYVQLGQADDALSLLEAEPDKEGTSYHGNTTVPEFKPHGDSEMRDKPIEDTRVVLHRYNLYVTKGDKAGYSRAGHSLLAFLFRDFYYRPEVKEMTQLKKIKSKLGLDPEKGKTSSELKKEEKELESLLTMDEWYKIFVTTCTGMFNLGPYNYPTIIHLIYCACLTKKFSDELYKRFLFFSISLSLLVQDYGTAFFLLKTLGNIHPDCRHVWNIMNALPLDNKVYKYILRLCFKHQSNPYLSRILSSHNHANGHYKFALCQYVSNFNKKGSVEDKYLLSLCIAIVFINMACQTRTSPAGRNTTVTQASAFLHTYVKLRGECQETSYNLGRAFHQLGILHMACHFYKQVLYLTPECPLPGWRGVSDLKSEAGFNLSLIYRASQNNALALHMLRIYCTV